MTDDDPHADLKQHALSAETMAVIERRVLSEKIRKRRKQFIKVPFTWYERLNAARHIATYRVALYVLYLHWKHGGQPFPLANGMLAMDGVNRFRKSDGLRELEALGLVRVDRRQRKSPVITVVI
jgi:hypothetical protein